MKGRIPANSESLKKNFPEVYQELFSKYPIVVSAPGSFWWTGEHVVLYGNFGINQKIPLRTYIGFEPISSPKIKIGTCKEYLPEKQNFFDFVIDESIYEKLTLILSEKLAPPGKGISIYCVSEVPISRGLNFSGAFTAALSVALFLYLKKVSHIQVANWLRMNTFDLIQDKNFDELFRFAWKIESVFHGDIASGGTILGSINSGGYPFVYFPPKFPYTDELRTKYWESRYAHLNTLNYGGAKLNELFDLTEFPVWPIDFGLIYSGETRKTASVILSTAERKSELNQVEKEIQKLSKKYSGHIKDSLIPNWPNRNANNFLDIFIQQLKTISCEILIALKNIFRQGSSRTVLNKLFISMNRNHELLRYLIPTSSEIDTIYHEIREYGAGVKVTGGGGKGDVVFAADYSGIRDEIFSALKRISRSSRSTINLNYASWLDGFENEGLKIEQNLLEHLYSEYISRGSIQIRKISSKGSTDTHLYTIEEFAKQRANMGLILDGVEDKIYIKGKEIHSKDIPSSKTTIKVLKILFENVGREVKNTIFGQGSYFEDRNEFQSKIVTPLNRTIEKLLGKHINISVTGNLYDFRVKLSPSPFDMYLIERNF